MDQEQSKDQAKHTYTMCVLFGLWLQQKEQRKRLAKAKITELFSEWITELSNKMPDNE